MPATLEFVAFDLDGVVGDTEPLHKRAKIRIFQELGINPDFDLDAFVGRPNSELWGAVIEEYGLPQTAAALEALQYDYIVEQLFQNRTPVSRGLLPLLDCLDEAGIRHGMYSASDRHYVDRVLEYFQLRSRFAPVVGGDEVPRKKPAPDGYEKVVRDAGVLPAHAIAIEDTKSGVSAANAAGLRCIGYRNTTSGDQDLSQSYMQVRSLDEVTEWIRTGRHGPACTG